MRPTGARGRAGITEQGEAEPEFRLSGQSTSAGLTAGRRGRWSRGQSLSPQSGSGPTSAPTCNGCCWPPTAQWSRAQLHAFGKGAGGRAARTVCTLEGKGAGQPTRTDVQLQVFRHCANQECHPSPSPTEPGLRAQQLKVPHPPLSSSCPGLGGCGKPVLSRAGINFLTRSHMPWARLSSPATV